MVMQHPVNQPAPTSWPFPLPGGTTLRYPDDARPTDIVMVVCFTPGEDVGQVDVQLFGPEMDPAYADSLGVDAYLDTLSDGMKRVGHYASEFFEQSFQDMDLDLLQ